MDHEVQDDVNVEGAWAEDAESMCLKEHGAIRDGSEGSNSGVEALKVPDLKNALPVVCDTDERVGLRQGRGDGLFNENMDAGEKELGSDVGMREGGNADRGGVDRQGGKTVSDASEDGKGHLGGEGACALLGGLNEGDQRDRVAGVFEFAVDANVVAPEGSGTADNGTEWGGSGHWVR